MNWWDCIGCKITGCWQRIPCGVQNVEAKLVNYPHLRNGTVISFAGTVIKPAAFCGGGLVNWYNEAGSGAKRLRMRPVRFVIYRGGTHGGREYGDNHILLAARKTGGA